MSTWVSDLASYFALISVLSSSRAARSNARIFNFNGSLNAAESRLQHHPTPITPQLRVWPSPFRPLYACGGSTHLQSHSGVHAGSSALLSLDDMRHSLNALAGSSRQPAYRANIVSSVIICPSNFLTANVCTSPACSSMRPWHISRPSPSRSSRRRPCHS